MNGLLFQIFLLIASYSSLSESRNTESNEIDSYIFNATSLKNETKISNTEKKLICFYVFTKAFNPKIMEGLCTHINVGFFRINTENNSIEISDEQKQILQNIVLLKETAKDLKLIISIGGATAEFFSEMVKTHKTRKMFIRSCMEVLKKFNLDGIDLDWEWPVVENGNIKEKVKFVQLLREIREEFNLHEKKYILSADVPSMRELIDLGYYVNYIADFVDYVNVMCYDYNFFTILHPFTGYNAPLFSPIESFFSRDINESISIWISKSMPREKIILGIPTYGHTFELLSTSQHYLFAPAIGYGAVGQNGFADYQQICQFLKLNNTNVVYDSVSKVPYAYNTKEWISFDDEGSLAIKANYVLSENLGGAMVFSVNADDFNGSCDKIILPLIRKIRNILFNEV